MQYSIPQFQTTVNEMHVKFHLTCILDLNFFAFLPKLLYNINYLNTRTLNPKIRPELSRLCYLHNSVLALLYFALLCFASGEKAITKTFEYFSGLELIHQKRKDFGAPLYTEEYMQSSIE